jgi:hypothetical protein
LAVAAILVVLEPIIIALSWLRSRHRQVAVALIAVCLASAPLPLASSHDTLTISTAEAARHAVLVAQEIAEHGHSHDDGEPHEQSAGHLHGHDPADHSHQAVFLAGTSSNWCLPPSRHWSALIGELPDPATGFGIERPPKQAMSL